MRSPIVNNNQKPYHYNTNSPQWNKIKRIQPNKFTFLIPNYMTSNILHRKHQNTYENSQDKLLFNAYNECDKEKNNWEMQTQQNKLKIEKCHNNAVKTLKILHMTQKEDETKIIEEVNQIKNMKQQMIEKAAEIMGKYQDSSYKGRKKFMGNPSQLKKIKQNTPNNRTDKIDMTKKFMKDKTKRMIQDVKSMINLKQESSIIDDKTNNYTQSVTESMLSQTSKIIEQKIRQNEHFDKMLKTNIQNRGYGRVLSEQKRRAAWQGFALNWKKGNQPNSIFTESTKQVKKTKKPKGKKINEISQTNSILNWTKLSSGNQKMENLNQYLNQFRSASQKYLIVSR